LIKIITLRIHYVVYAIVKRCCGVFSWFWCRDINDFTYLLTYLLT